MLQNIKAIEDILHDGVDRKLLVNGVTQQVIFLLNALEGE